MKPRNVALVVLWMAGALVSFSAVALTIRVLSRSMSLFEILALRAGGGLVVLCLAALVHPPFRAGFRPAGMRLHAARNVIHFASQYAWAYGLTALPFATVFALEFTAPVWLALLAVPLLGERLTVRRAGAIALGLAGVLVILRPGLEALRPASFVVLAAAFGFASVAVATKALTREVSTFSILFWMNLMQLALNALGSDPLVVTRIAGPQWPAVLCLVAGGLAAHLCLTQAYRHGDAIVVMPLDFLRIPLIAVIGWQVYGEPLDPFVFLGGAFIIVGILWNLSGEAAARGDATPSRTPGSGPGS